MPIVDVNDPDPRTGHPLPGEPAGAVVCPTGERGWPLNTAAAIIGKPYRTVYGWARDWLPVERLPDRSRNALFVSAESLEQARARQPPEVSATDKPSATDARHMREAQELREEVDDMRSQIVSLRVDLARLEGELTTWRRAASRLNMAHLEYVKAAQELFGD